MPFNSDIHLIFEKYASIHEGVESRMKYLLPFVPEYVPQDETVRKQFVEFVANNYDPSPEKSLTQWVLKMMQNGSIRIRMVTGDDKKAKNSMLNPESHEDKDKTFTTLKKFLDAKLHKKLQGTEADINSYKTLPALTKHLQEKLTGVTTKREQTKLQEQAGMQQIADHGNLQLYVVTTPEAANKIFQSTQWCVKDPKYFNSYKEQDNTSTYYMVYDNSKKESGGEVDLRKAALANFATDQFMDTFDSAKLPTPDQAQLFLKAKDYIESHEPEHLGILYARMHTSAGLPIPEIVVENVIRKQDAQMASELYELMGY